MRKIKTIYDAVNLLELDGPPNLTKAIKDLRSKIGTRSDMKITLVDENYNGYLGTFKETNEIYELINTIETELPKTHSDLQGTINNLKIAVGVSTKPNIAALPEPIPVKQEGPNIIIPLLKSWESYDMARGVIRVYPNCLMIHYLKIKVDSRER